VRYLAYEVDANAPHMSPHPPAPIERLLIVSGAGISADSGIPTFRGPGGYWRNMDPTRLATPEAFAADPALVWAWYRERRAGIRAAAPNPAHEAVVQLARTVPQCLVVTQNVDDLHLRARWQGQALLPESLVQVHGDIFITRCSRCDARQAAADDEAGLPACGGCGAPMRPGVVWFGESLDPLQIDRVERFLSAGPCDAVIVVGTTAVFGYIVDWAVSACEGSGPLIEVNPAATELSRYATETIRASASEALPQLAARLLG